MKHRLLVITLLTSSLLRAADPPLVVTYGPAGPTSIKYLNVELLAQAPFEFHAKDENDKTINLKAPGEQSAKQGSYTHTWDAASVTCVFTQEGNTLRLTLTVRNTSQQKLQKLSCQPLSFHFPQRPKGGQWFWGYSVCTNNDGDVGVVDADWGGGKLVACCDELDKPCNFGFAGNFGNGGPNTLLVEAAKGETLEPGAERTWKTSLRFVPSGTPTVEAAKDLFQQFTSANPYSLAWEDRRPIGAIFIALSNTKWKTNPRGYFNDEKVDVTTDAGRAAFKERLMKYGQTCVSVMKDNGAQGMILWDVEGDEMPHAITYLGDPRVLPQAAPEMDACADEFFALFRNAGLKVGVCIRPSKVIPNPKGGWKHQQAEDHIAEMSDKIAYAKKRWGCTIFYMDTNVKWPMNPNPDDATKGMWQGDASVLKSKDLQELCRRNPDVLIFPEFGRLGYYACCMPYGELRGGSVDAPAISRAVYPHCGLTIKVADGDYPGNWDALLAGLRGGSIHVFNGWFGDPMNQWVKRCYQELALEKAVSTKSAPLTELLADPDPAVRYQAIAKLSKPDAEQTGRIVERLPRETEWVVRRRMVVALGQSGLASAAPALTALAQEPKSELDEFTGNALGQIGEPATPALIELLNAADPRLNRLALRAFEHFSDPKALPGLLTQSKSASWQVRVLAAHALGESKDSAAGARLIEMLSDAKVEVLNAVCHALEHSKDRSAVKPLVALLERSVKELHDNHVRTAGGEALEAITGQQFGPYEQQWKHALDAGKL